MITYNLVTFHKDHVFDALDTGVSWGYLSWRAIVPLVEMGYKDKHINQLVKVFGTATSVDEIILWYKEERKTNTPDTYTSGRKKSTVIRELISGTYTPSLKNCEAKIFDHPHFRLPRSRQGIMFLEYQKRINNEQE